MFCPFIKRHVIQRIGENGMQDMNEPAYQDNVNDNQNKSERRI